jgi:hypothetical protein
MAEQRLDDADIAAGFEQVRGEAVAQRVNGDWLVQIRLAGGQAAGRLQRRGTHRPIGQLKVETNFLARTLRRDEPGQHGALVERENPALSVSQECRLLAVSRSAVYRRPAEVSAADRAIVASIDRQYLARPYYGSRRMAGWLATQRHRVNCKRVQRLCG